MLSTVNEVDGQTEGSLNGERRDRARYCAGTSSVH